ncbi:MAG: hypothetical protein IBV52_09510, partial [Candidatus Bathyarchaeota archaeon]
MTLETIVVNCVMILFGIGVANLYRHLIDMYRFERTYLRKSEINLGDLIKEASNDGGLPYFAVMIPAREE